MNSYRILDANINRTSEGLRVIEDIMRFNYCNIVTTEKLKKIRHNLRKNFKEFNDEMIFHRDSVKDVGLKISQSSKIDNKHSINELITANFKRASESLRVIEEISKIIDEYDKSKLVEQIRFQVYEIEKEVSSKFIKQFIPRGLYGITCERFSNGRSNVECVKQMVDAGVKIIQYRNKNSEIDKKLREAETISKICKSNGVVFIVNDHIDIALAVDADGVHLGQNDFDIQFAKSILGPNKIIGRSTHSPKQAEKAVSEGADYIGVGPIFKTTTKDTAPVSLKYLEYAVKNIKIPFIAIGGIKEHNLDDVLNYGAERVSLVSEIVGAENIKQKADLINRKILGTNN
ncbi:MAG: thiamine phosphate synthase [bacterium]|nr:thiamine phosphate synthase [bacterium]